MKKIFVYIFAFSNLVYSCKTTSSSKFTIKKLKQPYGTVKISDNLYFDKNEIRNLDYLEFIYWTEIIFGSNSVEFKNILPDSTVWTRLNANYAFLDTVYLRHPAYRNYPIVGVSYEQALMFSKWRSDRVMEFVLIRNKILPHVPWPRKDNYFTIEKYYKGEYNELEPNPNFLIYPHYTLPDSSTYYKASIFADSINKKNYKYCHKKHCANKFSIDFVCSENKSNRTEQKPYGPDPTTVTYCFHCKKDIIAHLKGNVKEMTNVKGVLYGGSFLDSCKSGYNKLIKDTASTSSYIGFRNMCEYRQWKK